MSMVRPDYYQFWFFLIRVFFLLVCMYSIYPLLSQYLFLSYLFYLSIVLFTKHVLNVFLNLNKYIYLKNAGYRPTRLKEWQIILRFYGNYIFSEEDHAFLPIINDNPSSFYTFFFFLSSFIMYLIAKIFLARPE